MSNLLQRIGRHLWSRNFLLASIGGLVGAFAFTSGSLFDSFQKFGLAVMWSMLIWYTQWYGHGYIADWLGARVPWSEQPRKRLILDFLLHTVYAFIAISVVNLFMEWVLSLVYDIPLSITTEELLMNGGVAIVIALVISGIMTSIGFYQHLRASLEREAELKTQLLQYRYESLRSQINPHFLFNSLNVLSELVVDEPRQAVTFIHGLSDTYRYVLDAQEREWVSLSEELALVSTYANLLHVRFEDRLQLKVDVPHQLADRVVPMALQLLLENAVKHNVVSASNPLTVRVFREGQTLCVENPKRPKNTGVPSRKVGLENLRQRYAFFPGAEVTVTDTEHTFRVCIPILQEDTP